MPGKKKYTVLVSGRHGKEGEILEMHPKQATFLLSERLVVEGEKAPAQSTANPKTKQVKTTTEGEKA